MKKAFLCFTVDDVGMEGYSSERHLENIIKFCGENSIPATFFAVPFYGDRELGKAGCYKELLREACSIGHEVAQHGLRHERFEVGIPPRMILDMEHEAPAREYLAKNRARILEELSVPGIRSRLREGRDIIQDVSGREVKGFRAPALQTCENLFEALSREEYSYDSSLYLQKAGWDLIAGRGISGAETIKRETWEKMREGKRINEFPVTTEYTWYLGQDRFDQALALAKSDFDSCAAAGIPFVPNCHVSPVQEGGEGVGFELYRLLLIHAREKSVCEGFELKTVSLSGLTEYF